MWGVRRWRIASGARDSRCMNTVGYYYMLIEGKVKTDLGYMLGRHKAPETSPTHLLCHFFGYSASLFLQLVSPTNPLNGP